MAGGTATDAKRVFEALASHLAGKRMELWVAIEQERGVEAWLQHEAVVALENAYRGDLAGRLYSVRREGLRHESAPSYDSKSQRRPFDLVFDAPDMAASLKLYLPWKTGLEAAKDIRRDLLELRDHPHQGFLIAGRLDYEDGLTGHGRKRKEPTGDAWLVKAVSAAQSGVWLPESVRATDGGMRLRSLVQSAQDESAKCLHIELPPMAWTWPDGKSGYREPFLAFGAWSVYKPSVS